MDKSYAPADIATCIFKTTPPEPMQAALAAQGYRVIHLTRNPHLQPA